jgi:hypothetical protein
MNLFKVCILKKQIFLFSLDFLKNRKLNKKFIHFNWQKIYILIRFLSLPVAPTVFSFLYLKAHYFHKKTILLFF